MGFFLFFKCIINGKFHMVALVGETMMLGGSP